MGKLRIAYVERKFDFFVSIERVFRLISNGLDPDRFSTSFGKLHYGNNLSGTIMNLLRFRPERTADIHHVTGHCHYIALRLPVERTVLTIHDIGILHIRTGVRRWALKKLLLEMPLKRLRYITAVSQATKDEIEAHFGKLAEKVRVIENPLDDVMRADGHKEFDAACPRILQIGSLPNKNVENVIRAIEGLGCRLTIVGELGPELKALLNEKAIDYAAKVQITDEELAAEYREADMLVFCSTFEGFGLPIIEAQAAGLPVITSDMSPMKDVAGDGGAVLVDPFDPLSIRNGIERVISDAELRKCLVQCGLANIARFDKRRIAAKYAELYEEIAAQIEREQ